MISYIPSSHMVHLVQVENINCGDRWFLVECHVKSMANTEIDDLEDFDDDEDFDESLPCSFKYVRVCLLLPAANGFLNAFLWPAYTLYFEAMGWPVVRAGLAVSVGFGSRVFLQQFQLRTGYWLIVPLSAVHLAVVILALIYQEHEWAVFLQIVVWLGIDPTCAIEGIAFDSFGDSEVQARQATSTVLSVFTIAFACSCTFGGILYDAGGWTGMALYHISLQGLMTLLLVCEPACRHSFKAVFFGSSEMETDQLETDQSKTGGDPAVFVNVVPAPKEEKEVKEVKEMAELPGAIEDLEVKDVEEVEETKPQLEPKRAPQFASEEKEEKEEKEDELPDAPVPAHNRMSVMTGGTGVTAATQQTGKTKVTGGEGYGRLVRRADVRRSQGGRARQTVVTELTKGTSRSKATTDEQTSGRLRRAQQRLTVRTNASGSSGRSGNSNSSRLTVLSKISILSESGQHFQNHFAASQATLPQIVGATGRDSVLREELNVVNETGDVLDAEIQHTRATIPKDVRLPAACVTMNSFCNTCAYILEYATFAIYFKQVHNWNEASLAGMSQMAGDVLGALIMQLIPVLFRQSADPDDLGCFRRFWYYLLSKPYTLTVTLFTWILFNLGMVTPSLPVAITAQVLMGTTFVYSCKWSTDMNLFYSLGDSQVFLSLQVWCRNADAIGGSVAGVLATWLFSLDPAAPFAFGAGMACLVFTFYTVMFCLRVGFGEDIESAEEKRARRYGLRRVSSWKSQRKSRKTEILKDGLPES